MAQALAARANHSDIAAVWAEMWANDHGYYDSHLIAFGAQARLMRFAEGRTGALVPHREVPPAGSLGRYEAIRSILAEHDRALLGFLGTNEAARRVVTTLETIVAEVHAQPGGDERFCPAAIAEANRIVDETRAGVALDNEDRP